MYGLQIGISQDGRARLETVTMPPANLIPNPTLSGVNAGADTPPTGWSISKPSGVSVDIVGSGVDGDGIPYMDVRFFGTPGASGNCQIDFCNGVAVAGASGEQHLLGFHGKLTAGDFTNVGSKWSYVMELDSGGSYIDGSFPDASYGGSGDALKDSWITSGRLFSHGTTAHARYGTIFTATSGNPIDFTVRIGTPIAHVDGYDITCWGDSLTQGVSQLPYPSQLAHLLEPKRLVSNQGVGGETSTEVSDRVTGASAWRRDGIQILWWGRNNPTQITVMQNDLKDAIAAIPHGRYIIIPWLTSSSEGIGSDTYVERQAYVEQLQDIYGDRVYDPFQDLLDAGTGTGQDATDVSNGVIPTSLRADSTHLNSAGYAVVAQGVKDLIDAKGW